MFFSLERNGSKWYFQYVKMNRRGAKEKGKQKVKKEGQSQLRFFKKPESEKHLPSA